MLQLFWIVTKRLEAVIYEAHLLSGICHKAFPFVFGVCFLESYIHVTCSYSAVVQRFVEWQRASKTQLPIIKSSVQLETRCVTETSRLHVSMLCCEGIYYHYLTGMIIIKAVLQTETSRLHVLMLCCEGIFYHYLTEMIIIKAVVQRKLKGAQCSEPVKSSVPSIWFVWKIWDFLVAQEQKVGTRGHRALLDYSPDNYLDFQR